MSAEHNTTPICGRHVVYRDDVLDINELQFWEANPRVYAVVRGHRDWAKADPARRQEIITECMKDQESTQSVLEGLKLHGGQQEPLIVDLRGNIVIEGNSRLAALLILAENDDRNWGAAICRCYNDLAEEERFALLSEMHVIGKTEWTPYAKAATYWREHDELKWDFVRIAEIHRTSVAKVKAELATIDLMTKENELNERKYSWYNVLTSTRAINQVFKGNGEFRDQVLAVVREASPEAGDPVARASNTFRDALTALVKKQRPLQQFCAGRRSLQEASDEARISGLSAKLRKARDVLRSIDGTDFTDLSATERNDAVNTFRRLRKDIGTITRLFGEGA